MRMANLIRFPEPAITEEELRAARLLMEAAWNAETQARLMIDRLCKRVEQGAEIEASDEFDFLPGLRLIHRRETVDRQANRQPG